MMSDLLHVIFMSVFIVSFLYKHFKKTLQFVKHSPGVFISDIAVFVLKRNFKLQPTNQPDVRLGL